MNRRLLANVHAWLSLALAAPLLALVTTGGILLFKNDLFAPILMTEITPDAGLATLLRTSRMREASVILVGDEERPLHTVEWTNGEIEYFDASTGAAHEADPRLQLEHSLYLLHTELLVGELGDLLIRVFAPLFVLIPLIGLILWWPGRAQWRWQALLPGASRPRLLGTHLAIGALIVIPAIMQMSAGGLLAHNPTIRSWLKPLATIAPLTEVELRRFGPGDSADAIAAVREAYPEVRISQVFPLRSPADNSAWIFKLRLPGESHPNGRSLLEVDVAAGKFGKLSDARRDDIAAAYDDTLYPLHVGSLSGWLRYLWVLTAIGLCLLIVSGVWSFLKRPRRP